MSCPCGDPAHDGLVDGADLVAAATAKDQLAGIMADMDLPGAEVSVALAIGEHGPFMRDAIGDALRDDGAHLAHVTRLQSWAEPDRQVALARLGTDAVGRADATARRLAVIGAGITLAAGPPDDVLALSAAAAARAGQIRVRHTMLSDGVRARGHTLGARRHEFGLEEPPHIRTFGRRQDMADGCTAASSSPSLSLTSQQSRRRASPTLWSLNEHRLGLDHTRVKGRKSERNEVIPS